MGDVFNSQGYVMGNGTDGDLDTAAINGDDGDMLFTGGIGGVRDQLLANRKSVTDHDLVINLVKLHFPCPSF